MEIRRPGRSRSKAADAQAGDAKDSGGGLDADGAGGQGRTSIAIVGLACRYPDADDVAGLFQVIIYRRRAFRRIPPGRINLADYYNSDPRTPDATYSTRAALIEGWRFDLAAFGISQASYLSAEPAHWLALETAARALAAAGFPGGTGLPAAKTGVFIGGSPGGDAQVSALRLRWPYSRQVIADALTAARAPADLGDRILKAAAARYLAPFPAVGADTPASAGPGPIAAAICDQFGFGGGGVGVDAGAASSLAAVASACSALTAGDLDAAVVGGVDVCLDPLNLVGPAQAGLLATGDMRIYDQNPTGFLPGEGCGMVLLMRTADALTADLPVYAEILGCGVASAGHQRRSPADPGSMLLALRRAYERAQIDPVDVHLFEGCGTGVGPVDEAELTALAMVRSGARRPATIGAVTANIGNTGAAAGAAGLIKAVLATANGVLPPTAGVRTPHQILRDGGGGLRTATAPQPWPDGRGPRYAGVSARSLDGMTAHVVLRGAADEQPAPGRGGPAEPVVSIGPASPRSSRGTRTRTPASIQPDLDRPSAFLVHAPDRRALIAVLSRIADVAPWLSDAQLHDLACQLAVDAAGQGRVKVAIVATRQEQLARLAGEAITMVPKLTAGLVSTRPGIFAADDADGQVTLLLAGRPRDPAQDQPQNPAQAPPDQLRRTLTVLRRLDELGVQPTAAVGHGVGELAGLVWAGRISAIDEFAGFEFRAPQGRLYSHPDGLAEAVRLAAAGASLLLQTDRDRDLTRAIGQLAAAQSGPGQRRKVAVVCIDGDPADDRGLARAAAALFAAGALTKADLLYAGNQSRPIDIWPDPVFITHPCQAQVDLPTMPREPSLAAPPPPRSPISPPRQPDSPPIIDPPRPAGQQAAGELPETEPAVTGVAPWFRCYAEHLRTPVRSITPPVDRPWRIYTGGRDASRNEVVEHFRHEPPADRTLAVLGRPSDPAAVEAALLAAQDAIRTGRLLAISPHPGWAGLWASLRAEHPATGITTVRAELDPAGLRAVSRIGVAAGEHHELAIEADGSVRELVMTPAQVRRVGHVPFGPDDVVLVSRAAGTAGLALAHVLACCGTAVVVVGRDDPARDDAVIAALEQLRQAGAAIAYEIVNPASAAALDAALRRIERRLGPVTAVAHAAKAGPRRAIANLTGADLRAQAVEETKLLDRLVTAARGPDRALRFVITFGSIAGRYGLAEGATTALTAGALADYGERLAAASPGCRALHLDWSAAMPPAQGTRLLLNVLGSAAELPSRLALHGRLGEQPPAPIALATADDPTATGHRFTERLLVHYPGVELIAEAVIDTSTDPYLADYVVDGASLLPPTIAIEAMAEAASTLTGGPLRAATEVSMAAPVVLSGQHPTAVIRLCALGSDDDRTAGLSAAGGSGGSPPRASAVTVILRCDSTEFAVDHFRATFRPVTAEVEPLLGAGWLAADEPPAGVVKADQLYGPVLFQGGRFKRLTTVRFSGSSAATGLIDRVAGQEWFAWPAALVLGSAVVTDAAMQLAQVCVPHRRLMFGGCGSVTFTGREVAGVVQLRVVEVRSPPVGDGAVAALVPRQRTSEQELAEVSRPAGGGPTGGGPAETTWDVDAIDADGEPVACFRGLVMRDAGPLPRTSPWPVALAGCFIERAAAELGLGPGLEVRLDRRPAATRQRIADGWSPTCASDLGPPGLILRVRAQGPAACGWRVVKPTSRKGGARSAGHAGRWLAVLDDQHSGLDAATGRSSAHWARAMALASCAGPAADPQDLAIEARPVSGTDWLLARTGTGHLACAVIEVAGAAYPVAIAIMTGVPDRPRDSVLAAQGSSERLALR